MKKGVVGTGCQKVRSERKGRDLLIFSSHWCREITLCVRRAVQNVCAISLRTSEHFLWESYLVPSVRIGIKKRREMLHLSIRISPYYLSLLSICEYLFLYFLFLCSLRKVLFLAVSAIMKDSFQEERLRLRPRSS